MTEGTSGWLTGCHTETARRSARRVNLWGGLWALAFLAVGLFGDASWLDGPGILAGAAFATAIPGMGMVLAYRKMLGAADELRRKIEIDALALAAGSALVVGSVAWVLENGGLIEDPVALVLVGMALAYLAGLVLGYRRYR